LFRKWGLPIISFFGLVLGIYMVHRGNKQPPPPPIPFEPPTSPYKSFIAASGIIEASSENVPIGVSNGQVVETIFVKPGDICKSGDPLIQVDTRVFKAQLENAKAQVETAKAELEKLIKEPRPEEVPPLEFEMYAQEANWKKALAHLDIYKDVTNFDAISKDEYQNALYSEVAALNVFKQAKANLSLKLAGAWIEDIMIASKTVQEKETNVKVTEAQLDQTLIRAPFDGQVLQVKLYPGSFAQSYYVQPYYQASMILYGRIDPLHIRIQIDEEDCWRYRQGSSAVAFVRGNAKISVQLNFVRIEPYVIPKRKLTGDNYEQTDTRVFEVIYSFPKDSLPVYIGQMMDVYLEAPPNQL
jgi:HlyD family secretion protein